ncbi:MAG: hypothetical protein JST04_00765 [Bdellovibrionales bacterium]|nr:hypothetical protein [Bdellovibrionales bacterium]
MSFEELLKANSLKDTLPPDFLGFGKAVNNCLKLIPTYPIVGYEDSYTICRFEGHYFVYSKYTNKYISNYQPNNSKNYYVVLYKNGNQRHYNVENLYLEAISQSIIDKK